jgi:hypothetical protein
MTTLIFPSNPTIGQQYISDVGTSWFYDGVKWTVGQVITQPVVVTPEVPPVTPTPTPPTTVYDSLLNISFPVNPTIGQIYTAPDGIAYIWKGDRWSGYGGNTVIPTATVTVLPKATQTTLGGVIVGPGIVNADGVISVDTATITAQVTTAVQASVGVPATKTTAGQVIIGDNINVTTDGTISVNKAAANTLGLVKTGDSTSTHVNIALDGTISVPKGAGINTVTDIPNVNTTAGGAQLTDGSVLVYNAVSERWDTVNDFRSDTMDGGFY